MAQQVKSPPAVEETPVRVLGWEDLLERNILPTPVFLGFPCSSADKESTCNAGDLGSIPGLGRASGEQHGNPLQYSWLESPRGQGSLVGYSPWSRKESDRTELLKSAALAVYESFSCSVPSLTLNRVGF